MEKYIKETLDSLIDERIIDYLEIFVIDDGGLDRTLEIAKSYAEKYPKSVFPVHKENGGYGSTVNYSIDHATGKYFKLLDGDDLFHTEGLVEMVGVLQKRDIDICVTNVYEGNCETGFKEELFSFGNMKEIKIPEYENYRTLPSSALTFKTELLKAVNIKLPENSLYTDNIYILIPFSAAKRMISLECFVYYRRLGREGQSVDRKIIWNHRQELKNVLKTMSLFCNSMKACENYRYLVERTAGTYIITLKVLVMGSPGKQTLKEIRQLESEISEISEEVFDSVVHIQGKLPKLIYIMRKTNYLTYWVLELLMPVVKIIKK